MTAVSTSTLAAPRPALRIGARSRRAVLTLHIVAGVGLLGDVAVILAINVRAATTEDQQLAAAAYELLTMFPVLFGIPLSLDVAGDRARARARLEVGRLALPLGDEPSCCSTCR